MSILIGIFTFVLILVSAFLVLLVLAQKAKTDGGMGAALGGGATEAAFGADTGNVLTKMTQYAAITFFVLTFGLYLGHIYVSKHKPAKEGQLPVISAPAEVTPAGEAPAVEAPAVVVPSETGSAEAVTTEAAPSVGLPAAAPAETAQP